MQETRHDEVTEKRNKGAKMPETRLDEASRPAKREKYDTASDLRIQDLQKQIEELKKSKKEFRKKSEKYEKKWEESQKETEEFRKKSEKYEKKWEESQKSKKEFRKKSEKYEKKWEESQKETERFRKKFPTVAEIVESGKLRPSPNESNSSAHTNTRHRPATVKATLELKDELGHADENWKHREFWKHPTKPPVFPLASNSEGTTSLVVYEVLKTIMDPLSTHLGFEITDVLHIQSCISLLDTIPDLGLLGPNKIIASTIEIKKNPKKGKEFDKIFGSGKEVAGEVYEQLYLVDTNNFGSGGVGLLTTSEYYMLVSLDGKIEYNIEEIKNFFCKEKGKTQSTPDRLQTDIFKRNYLPEAEQKDFTVETLRGPEDVPDAYMRKDKNGNLVTDKNGNNQYFKHGRVAAIASQNSANYSQYASKVLSMTKEPKETLNLLAVFVILTLRNLMNYTESRNRNNIMKMTEFSARYLNVEDVEEPVFSLTAIELTKPIDFLCPSESCEGDEFYAIRQLGFGSCGVCCLALNKKGYACVLKFIHKHLIGDSDSKDMAQKAEVEAALWGKIYGEKYGIAAKCLQVNDRPIIAMPYLQIPSTRAEKWALCNGENDSKLYLGLKQFCDAGYIHKDLHWHHVGELPSKDSNSDKPCLLCDLENISTHKMSGLEKEQWVSDAFNALKDRLNPEQENCLQTPKK